MAHIDGLPHAIIFMFLLLCFDFICPTSTLATPSFSSPSRIHPLLLSVHLFTYKALSSFFLHILTTMLCSVSITAILTGVRWFLMAVSTCSYWWLMILNGFLFCFFVLKNLKRNFDHLLWKDAGAHVLSPVFRANKDFEDLQKGDWGPVWGAYTAGGFAQLPMQEVLVRCALPILISGWSHRALPNKEVAVAWAGEGGVDSILHMRSIHHSFFLKSRVTLEQRSLV